MTTLLIIKLPFSHLIREIALDAVADVHFISLATATLQDSIINGKHNASGPFNAPKEKKSSESYALTCFSNLKAMCKYFIA